MSEVQNIYESIIIFCDGACSGNPGPGGWGSVVVTPEGHVRELGGRASQTTNNQMELTAAIEALLAIENRKEDIILYTDSVYVIRGITQWIWGWMKNGWKTADGNDVSNREHWQELSAIVGRRKKISSLNWKFVKGHSGVPGNERCDEIAVMATKGQYVTLYDGPLLQYSVAIMDLPEDRALPEIKPKSTSQAKPLVYLSLLGGVLMRHQTWAECERRVKGQPGAKFKKAMSTEEEQQILKSWGVKG